MSEEVARVVEGVVGRDTLALGSVTVRGDWRKGWGRCIEGGNLRNGGGGKKCVGSDGHKARRRRWESVSGSMMVDKVSAGGFRW